jgi:hypothetical protein
MFFVLALLTLSQLLCSTLDFHYAIHSQLNYFEVVLVPSQRCFKRDKFRIKFKYPFDGQGDSFQEELERRWSDKRIKIANMSSENLSQLTFNQLTTLVYRAMMKRGYLLIKYKLFRNEDDKFDVHMELEVYPIAPEEPECLQFELSMAQSVLAQQRAEAMTFVEFFQQCHPDEFVDADLEILTSDLPSVLDEIIDLISETEMLTKKLSYKAAEHYVGLAKALQEKCEQIKTDKESVELCLEYSKALPRNPSVMISKDIYKLIASFVADNNL